MNKFKLINLQICSLGTSTTMKTDEGKMVVLYFKDRALAVSAVLWWVCCRDLCSHIEDVGVKELGCIGVQKKSL